MLLSMTGHGDASGQNERLNVTAEVRSVNNRHLKITVRCPDPFLALEANIDRLVRGMISRGTLTIHLRIRALGDLAAFRINTAVARRYWSQLTEMSEALGTGMPETIAPLLGLPGLVDESESRAVEESDWPLIAEVLTAAMENLQAFRREEGKFMAQELRTQCAVLEEQANEIARRAPLVVKDYRDRLAIRVNDLLQEKSVTVGDADLIREVSLFADRCDISEEITRLRSHLQQYGVLLDQAGASGRKLEFLGQELFREINTIGSKSNDVEIAHRVVEMKAAIEKMREMIQNVE